MRDLGGPIGRTVIDAKLARCRAAYEVHGFGRWATETTTGDFLGYVGVMPASPGHPLGPHFELGWRLVRTTWGMGFATDAAGPALTDVFNRAGLPEVVAYTSPDNVRSQAVMERLGMTRDEDRDFGAMYPDVGSWHGLVRFAQPSGTGCRNRPKLRLRALRQSMLSPSATRPQ